MLILKAPRNLVWILITVNTFSRIAVSVTVRSSNVPPSNEFEQYYHYRNITNYNENFIHEINCQNITDHGFLKSCLVKEMEKAKLQTIFPSIWKSVITEITVGNNKESTQQIDCKYNVPTNDVKTNVKDFILSVYFKIIQSDCISKTNIPGGASFYINANTPHHLSSCGIIDLFDNNYNVECRLPLNGAITDTIRVNSMPINTSLRANTSADINSIHRRLKQQAQCMNISIVMEHEHYDVSVDNLCPYLQHVLTYPLHTARFCIFMHPLSYLTHHIYGIRPITLCPLIVISTVVTVYI
jgi:hypothetical protein